MCTSGENSGRIINTCETVNLWECSVVKNFNAPAPRLKKSCLGGSSWDFVWTSSQLVSVFGVCRWKRSGLSGRDNNGAA